MAPPPRQPASGYRMTRKERVSVTSVTPSTVSTFHRSTSWSADTTSRPFPKVAGMPVTGADRSAAVTGTQHLFGGDHGLQRGAEHQERGGAAADVVAHPFPVPDAVLHQRPELRVLKCDQIQQVRPGRSCSVRAGTGLGWAHSALAEPAHVLHDPAPVVAAPQPVRVSAAVVEPPRQARHVPGQYGGPGRA